MQTYDIKKQRKEIYARGPHEFGIVEVPPLGFLMVDGHGDTNISTTYREAFRTRDKSAWDWTLMITQPDWITAGLVEEAAAAARKKRLPALDRIRFERFTEGRSVQILHVGSYDDEAPTIDRLHREYLPVHGLAPSGRHHEIYLSDARKTEPARLKTILRQPVRTLPVSPGPRSIGR